MSAGVERADVGAASWPAGRVLVSTGCERSGEVVGTVLHLAPDEGVAVDISES